MEAVSVLVFLAVFLTALGLTEAGSSDRRLVMTRIKRIASRDAGKEEPTAARQRAELWRRLLTWAGGLSLARRLGRLADKKLEEADVLLRGGEFIVIVLACAVATSLVAFTITLNPAGSLVLGLTAAAMPFVALDAARAKRLASFNAQIGDALTITANSLRSGFSFLQSMDMVRKELPDPIKKEFTRTIKEISLGTPTEEALENMARRVNSEDLDLVVTAVLIQKQVGGNLAEVLDNIAETVRDRMRIKREIRTLTAQGRISGLIIGLLPLILGGFMMVVRPSYVMELFSSRAGWTMLTLAVTGELTGLLIIRKIVDIRF
ncbi:type II secretion system F family protein [Gelria sp. Kuro-4]|uniref:type II secretion system F family protein n=1 Tax=Gelria sp. Kuro-4 TaxID=2796927 RepID=UPI001BF01CDF|nr:type II secretion system F family protein [Gelria sp. Kuro-4]BCV23445.1 secretion system protein [Gelria sp. Kuro-4]